jgi:hypothetical protein
VFSTLRRRDVALAAVFVVAAGASLSRAGGLSVTTGVQALLVGVGAAFVCHLAAASGWHFAAAYRDRGGATTDAGFLLPFVAAALAGVAAGALSRDLVTAGWLAFWTFAGAVGVLGVVLWVHEGYLETAPGP